MRIRDWSSDVCSSDLLFLSLFLLLLALFILLNAISTIEPGRSNRVLDSVQRAFPSAYRAEIGNGVLEGDPGQVVGEVTRKRIELGRAPCRARVCQTV